MSFYWKCCLLLSLAAAAPAAVEMTLKSCAEGAAIAVVVCHRVPEDAICCCGLLRVNPVFLFIYLSKHNSFECTPWQCCRLYSLDSPKIFCS